MGRSRLGDPAGRNGSGGDVGSQGIQLIAQLLGQAAMREDRDVLVSGVFTVTERPKSDAAHAPRLARRR
jgi:hypothetical protein